MLTSQQQNYVKNFLEDKNADAKNTFIKGNRLGAAYLAMIAGMWANYFKRDAKANPFSEDDIWLYSHWADGYDAFSQALGLTDVLRKKQLEYEKETDAKRAQESGKSIPSKKGGLNTKLW